MFRVVQNPGRPLQVIEGDLGWLELGMRYSEERLWLQELLARGVKYAPWVDRRSPLEGASCGFPRRAERATRCFNGGYIRFVPVQCEPIGPRNGNGHDEDQGSIRAHFFTRNAGRERCLCR